MSDTLAHGDGGGDPPGGRRCTGQEHKVPQQGSQPVRGHQPGRHHDRHQQIRHHKGRGGDDTAFSRGGKDKVFGGDGDDHLDGGLGNDTLDGGPCPGVNHELLCGGAGNDVLRESTGSDKYLFADGWGQDTISGPGDPPSGVSDALDFSGDSGFCATVPVTVDLTIDLGAGKAFETAAGEDGANTVSWSPSVAGTQTTAGVSVIENTIGGSGADTITGSTHFNYVSGGGGGDTINVADGAFDAVDCGFDQAADTVNADSQDSVSSCDGSGDTVTRVS
jgi:Ca2+-binding RTX toxin-like protein